jgi:hypothetical protein
MVHLALEGEEFKSLIPNHEMVIIAGAPFYLTVES